MLFIMLKPALLALTMLVKIEAKHGCFLYKIYKGDTELNVTKSAMLVRIFQM